MQWSQSLKKWQIFLNLTMAKKKEKNKEKNKGKKKKKQKKSKDDEERTSNRIFKKLSSMKHFHRLINHKSSGEPQKPRSVGCNLLSWGIYLHVVSVTEALNFGSIPVGSNQTL